MSKKTKKQRHLAKQRLLAKLALVILRGEARNFVEALDTEQEEPAACALENAAILYALAKARAFK